jgi:hypothetical protein
MTINELLKTIEPEDRQVLLTMLAMEGFTVEDESDEAIQRMLLIPNKTQEEGNALLTLINVSNNMGKFASKLSFTQRCEILALHRRGCTRELLSKLYKVDRRTITHIYNGQSPHYRNVREEELRLGRNNFIDNYLTLDVQNAAFAYFGEKRDEPHVNNKAANKRQGVHNMQNDMCDYAHRVIIGWVEPGIQEDITVAGWYYKDLDSEWPDSWFHCGPESLRTSQACWAAAQEDISDKIS